jgi:hypothetical protein
MFLLGWLLWGYLFMDTFRSLSNPVEGAERAEPILWAIALSNVAWAYLYAYIFDRWASISTFKGGAMAGALMALLIGLSMDLVMYATLTMPTLQGLALDVVLNLVVGGIGGGVIGWVLGNQSK